MSDKDLDLMFINLKTVFGELTSKLECIINKYEVLEKMIESKKKGSFKCRKCKKKFKSLKELHEHKNAEESCVDKFKCEHCGKSFESEENLTKHLKIHGNFKCDECDCKLDTAELLEKHVSAVHGKFKIFCHYFNNEKECPFEGLCIFAHEDSPDCKFGKTCERMMCMFSHDERDVSDTEEEEESDDENDDDQNDDDAKIFKIQDIEPCLQKVEEAMDKVQQLLQQDKNPKIKCDKCEFEAKNLNGLNMHKKAKHPDNSN